MSPLLKRVVYPVLHQSGWLGRNPSRGGCAVVNYHGVIPPGYARGDAFLDANLVSLDSLQRQLGFLKRHYEIIPPETFRARIERDQPLPPRAVLVTCDDGLVNTLTDMLPAFRNENISGLFFITGASCSDHPGMLWYEELYHLMRILQSNGKDRTGMPALNGNPQPVRHANFQSWWWETVRRASTLEANARAGWMTLLRARCDIAAIPHPEQRWRLLNIHELRHLADAGMAIGAHTLSHPVLSQCGEQEARREIAESKIALERALNRPVWAFAYPFGNPSTMGARDILLAREAGFTCAFLNVGGAIERSHPYTLPRTHVSAEMNLAEFEAHLTGFHHRLQRAVRA